MLKRIRLDFAIKELDFDSKDFKDLKDLIKIFAKDKSKIINEGKDSEEKPSFSVHDCKHDTGEPCSNVVNLLDE